MEKKLPNVQNYHKHTDDTNPFITDSAITYEMLAQKTIENGGGILSSVAHAYQGRYHYAWQIAKTYHLKFIFGTEAYWVKDRRENDKTNNHIILLAKNKEGMKDINEILSIANEDGYYYKPRIDLDLLLNKLNKNNVFISTSCIAGWKYDDIEEIWLKLFNHFGNNFMLEIQYHNTEIQKKINKRILNLHKKYGIQMIVGLDTHVLDENGVQDRNDLLLSKKIKYHEEESDWYLDYPTNEIIFKRFLEQGVFNENEIIQAMDNTNILLDFEDIEFDKSMKLPTIYPHKTQEEKNQLMKDILNKEFVNFIKKNNINKEDRKKYIEEIKKEADVILNTNMADYFLLNYEIIKRGKELGGVITPSGRGCFEGQSLILTDNGLKKLKNIKVGNKVLTKNGKFEKVLDTFSYDIEEDLYEIIPKYYREGNIFNNKCTSDHKILVKTDDNNIVFKQAKDILLSDKVVVPKIKCNNININNYDIPYIKRNDLFKNDYLFNMFIGIIYRNSEIKDSVISMKLNEKPFEKIKSLIKYFNGTYEIYKNYIQVEIKNTELINFLYNTLQYKKDNEIKNVNFDYLLSLNKEQLSGLLAGLLNGNKNAITRFRNIANLVKIVGLMLDKYYNIGFEKFPYIHKSTGTTLKSRIEYIINLHQVEYDDNNFYLDIEKIKVHKNMNTRVYDIKVENEPSYTIHNMVVHNSSGGFLLNTLFGFSSMDRLKSPIKLFPERFLTEDRVKAGSLVDIDFNVSNPKPFIQAQKEVLGECHSYPMVAYGTIKAKSGFKMYARSQNLDFDIANEISTQIDKYEKAYIYASDEEKEELSIYDFIEEQYHHYIDKSKHYLGIMMDKKIAPCSHILYSQDDVRREIGVMRLTNRTTKEDVMVACIEGAIADKFGYLKNDL